MSDLKSRYIERLVSEYPQLQKEQLGPLISENLLSPYKIQLPKSLLEKVKGLIKAFHQIRENSTYQKNLAEKVPHDGIKDPGNKSIMMSYDFHLDESGVPKLIEINTNAAFLGMGYHMYEIHNQSLPVPDFKLDNLKKCIETELELFARKTSQPRVVIMDEQPEQQRLYVEFLLFRELFRKWDWYCEIADFRSALYLKPDFIYNRFTDFYFQNESSREMRKAFENKETCFSPNPYEYFLLADKNRMVEWSMGSVATIPELKTQNEIIQPSLLKCWPLTEENKEEIWSRRKNLFFKPTQEHGSKGSFRGGSVSRRAFDELINKNSLAQEYVPAPEVQVETPEGLQTFKYDLRFYSYQDQLQLVTARLYQGQTTNLRTPGGGFACVEFV